MPFLESLTDVLKDSSRPSFLFGSTPPREGTSEEKARESCAKFAARSAVLATDGFIVYDIQDEGGRTTMERPFPFRKTMDAAVYASYFPPVSGKQCLVYKSVVETDVASFDNWLDLAINRYGHNAFVFVGAPTSTAPSVGDKAEVARCTLIDAGRQASTNYQGQCNFGCVSIAERHTKKGNEHTNMVRKMDVGAEWFITQGASPFPLPPSPFPLHFPSRPLSLRPCALAWTYFFTSSERTRTAVCAMHPAPNDVRLAPRIRPRRGLPYLFTAGPLVKLL